MQAAVETSVHVNARVVVMVLVKVVPRRERRAFTQALRVWFKLTKYELALRLALKKWIARSDPAAQRREALEMTLGGWRSRVHERRRFSFLASEAERRGLEAHTMRPRVMLGTWRERALEIKAFKALAEPILRHFVLRRLHGGWALWLEMVVHRHEHLVQAKRIWQHWHDHVFLAALRDAMELWAEWIAYQREQSLLMARALSLFALRLRNRWEEWLAHYAREHEFALRAEPIFKRFDRRRLQCGLSLWRERAVKRRENEKRVKRAAEYWYNSTFTDRMMPAMSQWDYEASRRRRALQVIAVFTKRRVTWAWARWRPWAGAQSRLTRRGNGGHKGTARLQTLVSAWLARRQHGAKLHGLLEWALLAKNGREGSLVEARAIEHALGTTLLVAVNAWLALTHNCHQRTRHLYMVVEYRRAERKRSIRSAYLRWEYNTRKKQSIERRQRLAQVPPVLPSRHARPPSPHPRPPAAPSSAWPSHAAPSPPAASSPAPRRSPRPGRLDMSKLQLVSPLPPPPPPPPPPPLPAAASSPKPLDHYETMVADGLFHQVAKGSDSIPVAVMGDYLSSRGDISAKTIESMVLDMDSNGDGHIDLHEWRRAWKTFGKDRSAEEEVEQPLAAPRTRVTFAREIDEPTTAPNAAGVAGAEALRKALLSQVLRVIDLFRKLDANNDGKVSSAEFRRVLPLLATAGVLNAASFAEADVDSLFALLDLDGSGSIEYSELHKRLRQGLSVTLDQKLQAGAVLFDVEAKSRTAIAAGAAGAAGAASAGGAAPSETAATAKMRLEQAKRQFDNLSADVRLDRIYDSAPRIGVYDWTQYRTRHGRRSRPAEPPAEALPVLLSPRYGRARPLAPPASKKAAAALPVAALISPRVLGGLHAGSEASSEVPSPRPPAPANPWQAVPPSVNQWQSVLPSGEKRALTHGNQRHSMPAHGSPYGPPLPRRHRDAPLSEGAKWAAGSEGDQLDHLLAAAAALKTPTWQQAWQQAAETTQRVKASARPERDERAPILPAALRLDKGRSSNPAYWDKDHIERTLVQPWGGPPSDHYN
jgi:hypothetical protein